MGRELIIILALGIFTGVVLNESLSSCAPIKGGSWLTKYRYAHRGLHNDACPENSLPAFEQAIRQGYAIEIDVQLTKDGHVIVFHDTDLARMTGINAKVKHLTLKEIRQHTLNGTDVPIPTLQEVLHLVDGRTPLLIELKNMGRAGMLERQVYLDTLDYKGLYAVQSFSPLSLRWFKNNAPHICRGQLSCDFARNLEGISSRFKRFFLAKLLYLLQRLKLNLLCRPNFISYEFGKVHAGFLRKLRHKGTPILAWTVRNEEQLKQALPYTDSVIFEGFSPNQSFKRV